MFSHTHATGLSRREILQTGYSGLLGVGLPTILGGRAKAATPAGVATNGPQGAVQGLSSAGSGQKRPKSVIIVFLTGAPSHHDTFDMKLDAPAEIRGEFQSIATAIPGYQICEHLPQLAARADKYAIVRSLSHSDNNHLMSTHHVLTGTKQPGGFFDKVASRDDWPSYSSALGFLRPRHDGLPSGVNLPTFLREGPLTWPGQHAGFLGPAYDPWQINGDPNAADFRVDALTLAQGIDVNRLGHRQSLLAEFNRAQTGLDTLSKTARVSSDQQLAFSMLTSNKLASAFLLGQESDEVRNRYGRNMTGQSLLLARRLIQAGVPIVQANIGRVQNWDSHGAIFQTLKGRLLPPLDQGVAALLDDLESTGLLDETLVMMLGEFGRTPKINKEVGRDHWGPVFFGLFAGAGVRPGQVIGQSDETGAYPASRAYSPNDVAATVYHLLGIAPDAQVRDRLGRLVPLNEGHVIEPLFSGAEA